MLRPRKLRDLRPFAEGGHLTVSRAPNDWEVLRVAIQNLSISTSEPVTLPKVPAYVTSYRGRRDVKHSRRNVRFRKETDAHTNALQGLWCRLKALQLEQRRCLEQSLQSLLPVPVPHKSSCLMLRFGGTETEEDTVCVNPMLVSSDQSAPVPAHERIRSVIVCQTPGKLAVMGRAELNPKDSSLPLNCYTLRWCPGGNCLLCAMTETFVMTAESLVSMSDGDLQVRAQSD